MGALAGQSARPLPRSLVWVPEGSTASLPKVRMVMAAATKDAMWDLSFWMKGHLRLPESLCTSEAAASRWLTLRTLHA